MDCNTYKEIQYSIFSAEEINKLISSKKVLRLKAKRPVLIGNNCLLKVNMNIGVSDASKHQIEIDKLTRIAKLSFRPDSMMDNTIVPLNKPLWRSMVELFDGAVGTLPHYLPFDEKSGIDEKAFWENLILMAKGGVSFMTLHPTADIDIYNRAVASNRIVPITSRGGYVLLKDQVINHREQNIIAKNFDEIMDVFQEYGIAVSIGSVFRPATIWEAIDSFHKEETFLQKQYIDIARKHNVSVMMEGIGHVSLEKIEEYADMIRPFNVPLMPLGPMLSDEIIGFDHITNALGGLAIAQTGVVGMINSVTREEHTGKVPSFDSVLEGLKAARVTSHCYNISKFSAYKEATEVIGVTRAQNETCVQKGGIFGFNAIDDSEADTCTRCREKCPLKKIIV